MIFILVHWFVFSVEAFDVFCFGHLLYEISVGKPLYHVQMNTSTSNNVNDASYNTAILEGNEALPNQLPDSLSMSIIIMDTVYETNKHKLESEYFDQVAFNLHLNLVFRDHASIDNFCGCV